MRTSETSQTANRVSEALPSLSDRTRTFWVRMEIIESFQAFKNLADRTFRGRSLGYQDQLEPEVDVAERSNAWRGEPFRGPQFVLTHPVSIGVPHDVRIVRTLEPRLLWPDRYRIDASRRTDVMGHEPT